MRQMRLIIAALLLAVKLSNAITPRNDPLVLKHSILKVAL